MTIFWREKHRKRKRERCTSTCKIYLGSFCRVSNVDFGSSFSCSFSLYCKHLALAPIKVSDSGRIEELCCPLLPFDKHNWIWIAVLNEIEILSEITEKLIYCEWFFKWLLEKMQSKLRRKDKTFQIHVFQRVLGSKFSFSCLLVHHYEHEDKWILFIDLRFETMIVRGTVHLLNGGRVRFLQLNHKMKFWKNSHIHCLLGNTKLVGSQFQNFIVWY